MRVRMPETVVWGIRKTSAISAPVMRRRLSAAIASTRCSGVRLWTRLGADERSSSPSSPSALKRRTHSPARRSLTSAAAAASVSDHLSSTTRRTSSCRFFRLSAALPCSFIRCPPWH